MPNGTGSGHFAVDDFAEWIAFVHAPSLLDRKVFLEVPADAPTDTDGQETQLSRGSVSEGDFVGSSTLGFELRRPGARILDPYDGVDGAFGLLDDVQRGPIRREQMAIEAD